MAALKPSAGRVPSGGAADFPSRGSRKDGDLLVEDDDEERGVGEEGQVRAELFQDGQLLAGSVSGLLPDAPDLGLHGRPEAHPDIPVPHGQESPGLTVAVARGVPGGLDEEAHVLVGDVLAGPNSRTLRPFPHDGEEAVY